MHPLSWTGLYHLHFSQVIISLFFNYLCLMFKDSILVHACWIYSISQSFRHSILLLLFFCDLILNCYCMSQGQCSAISLDRGTQLSVWRSGRMLSYRVVLVISTRGRMWLKKFPFKIHLLRFDDLVMELEMTTSIKHSVEVALTQLSRSHQSPSFRPLRLGKYLGFIQTC